MSKSDESLAQYSSRVNQILTEIEQVMVGQEIVVRHAVAAFLAGGHVLFEDVPGTGKTTLASTFARSLGLEFHRVQGTPDLLPSELVGTMVFRPSEGVFEFRKGPVFTQVLLMDEINRATPRTQSALLEAMSEGQVSVDGQTHALLQPFFVMATANPIESQGVFPLPEAQLDRFLVQLRLGYVSEEDEIEMVRRIRISHPPEVRTVLTDEDVQDLRSAVRNVHVSDDIIKYIVRLCRLSREHREVVLGASPRAVLALTAFSQALALLYGRKFVIPDDVKEGFKPVMRHRIQTRGGWDGDGTEKTYIDSLLDELLNQALVPGEIADGVEG